ncbi:uncharacterized protein LOC119985306 [Tripterygium wilfordii]|uniref:uncharacterized protein LOC119985306 n=1 Tax=Tripterygium wilfordii TaxID=458696 RepID=UPI0018F8517D|nr:uncharacterized protein LOC119985306 [Tripterygium wilfordii]
MDFSEFNLLDSLEFERNEREGIWLSIHPHQLILSEEMKDDDEEILCRWCLDKVKDAHYYNCEDCSFSLHESCAAHTLSGSNHNWTSINEEEDGCYNCCWCCGEIVSVSDSSPSYVCRTCKVFLHESCGSNLPREIKHVFHRKHPLFLLPTCISNHKYFDTFFYCCHCCKFTLDMKTALEQPPLCLQEPENYKHQFIPLMSSDYSGPCDACGRGFAQFGVLNGPFLCTICRIVVHDKCTSLPHTINILHHNHPLTHTFLILLKEEDMPSVDQINCPICRYKLRTDCGIYYCAGCHFATHVSCGIDNQIISTKNPIVHVQDAIVDPFNKIKLTEDELPVDIKHFSHEHILRLCDEIEDKCCDGCIRPISHPFYRTIIRHITPFFHHPWV